MAARALILRGHRCVGFMGGPLTATSTQDRLKGFAEVLASQPDITLSVSYADAYSFDAGRREMLRLASHGPQEAYFCGDDVLSIGALSALKDSGLNVPQDVGIIGLNDMEMAGWENINLTTIRQPIRQIVNSSVELIAATLEEPDRYPEARLFPCRVIERGTLRPVP